MIIGIDVSMLNYQGSGVANYTFNLVKNLLKYDNLNEYRLFYSSFRRPKGFYYLNELKKLGAKVYEYPLPLSVWKILWGKYNLFPVEWLIGKVDVFMSSDFLRPPLLKGTKGITTIHDLTWKIFPQYHTQDVIDAHTRKLEKTVKFEDAVIVDSENTKKDLLKYYPEIKKIWTLYLAVNENFTPINNNIKISNILNKYRLVYPNNYLLYVGAIEPRKNLETAIKTFKEFISIKKYSDYKFLIVGRAGWKNENLFQLVKSLNLSEKVIFVGFVLDEDLPYFYNASKAFVYLSLYEGFGLPPVEATACSVPTLLYRNSSLSEIFKSNYPYTDKGRELKTLIKLIENKIEADKYIHNFSWARYVKSFKGLISDLNTG